MRRSIGSFVLAGVLFGTADAGAAPIAVTSAFGRSAVEHPRGVTLSDITGDGNADVVVANYTAAAANPGSISVFPGDSAGALGARRDYAVGDGPVSVVAADLNGDKRSDVAVADVAASKVSSCSTAPPATVFALPPDTRSGARRSTSSHGI